jgi:hypothetical protein
MGDAAKRRERVRGELGWLATTLAALVATFAFEHWIVHRQMILPALEATGVVLPWMWGALLAPEMVVAFVAGWRLRGAGWIVTYAVVGALAREGFEVVLARAGEPGHVLRDGAVSEFAFGAPFVALAYLVLFALASASGRSDDALDGTSPSPR